MTTESQQDRIKEDLKIFQNQSSYLNVSETRKFLPDIEAIIDRSKIDLMNHLKETLRKLGYPFSGYPVLKMSSFNVYQPYTYILIDKHPPESIVEDIKGCLEHVIKFATKDNPSDEYGILFFNKDISREVHDLKIQYLDDTEGCCFNIYGNAISEGKIYVQTQICIAFAKRRKNIDK